MITKDSKKVKEMIKEASSIDSSSENEKKQNSFIETFVNKSMAVKK